MWSWVFVALWVGCSGEEVKEPSTDDSDTVAVDTEETDPPEIVDTFDEAAPPTMVELEPGEFEMGGRLGDVGAGAAERPHHVTITYPFSVGTFEVTQSQFENKMGYNPSYWGGCPRCPVEEVSWHEAAAFANALSEAEGLQTCFACDTPTPPPGYDPDPSRVTCTPSVPPAQCEGYRLPTEAEWEFAARDRGDVAGSTPTGGSLVDEKDADSCVAPLALSDGSDLGEQAWYCGNSDATPGRTTRPIGGLTPNGAGIFDMSGNVWELCLDAWRDQYPLEPEVDPTPQGELDRVVRGGAWNSTPRLLRVSFRTSSLPSNRNNNLGFRVVRTLEVGR